MAFLKSLAQPPKSNQGVSVAILAQAIKWLNGSRVPFLSRRSKQRWRQQLRRGALARLLWGLSPPSRCLRLDWESQDTPDYGEVG